jgi:hypothetical protein
MWRAEGRVLADYQAGIKDDDSSEVWEWRRAHGEAWGKAEREAWLRGHPGNPLPEHQCSLTKSESREYSRGFASTSGGWQEIERLGHPRSAGSRASGCPKRKAPRGKRGEASKRVET